MKYYRFFSHYILASVALVSAPRTTPSLNIIPAIVVPVFLALGNRAPEDVFVIKNSFLNTKNFFRKINQTFKQDNMTIETVIFP